MYLNISKLSVHVYLCTGTSQLNTCTRASWISVQFALVCTTYVQCARESVCVCFSYYHVPIAYHNLTVYLAVYAL